MNDKELRKQLEEIVVDQHKEIEELRLELSGYRQAVLQDKEMLGLKQENELLHSIIKEVREKIENVQMLGLRSGKTFIATLLNDILEILDKGVDKE